MASSIKIVVNTAKQETNQTVEVLQGSGDAGQPTRIKAVKGARYQVEDPTAKNTAPQHLRTKRVGKNLHITLDGSTESDLIIDDYYDEAFQGEGGGGFYGRATDGSIYEYIPQEASQEGKLIDLADGGSPVDQVLGSDPVEDFELSALPLAAAAGGGLGAGGIAAGVAGASALGGGGGGTTGTGTDAEAALTSVKTFAQDNSTGMTGATGTAPTEATYRTAGVTGVTAQNLNAINSALASATLDGAKVDTLAKLQAIVDAYSAILAEANGTADDATPDADPTAAQYAAVGVTGVDPGAEEKMLGDVIGSKVAADVDTVEELQALADAVAATVAYTGAQSGPSASQLNALTGGSAVTPDNLAAVQAAIAKANGGSSPISSQEGLKALIDTAAQAYQAALEAIQAAAENNSANQGSPSVAQYEALGVYGVSPANLAVINSALDSAAVNGAATETAGEVQAIVNSYNAILAAADGVDKNMGAGPTQLDYSNVGVTGVDTPTKAGLLSDVVDGKAGTDIDTVQELQALADAVAATVAYTGAQSGPSATELNALTGGSAVTPDNLAAVQAAIAEANRGSLPISTQAQLQTLVAQTLGVDAQTAAEAAQAAAAAANTAKETLAQAQAALGSPATPEQIAAVETAQAAAIDAASAATSAAEAATAAASAAHAAAQAANEADPSGVAAANTAASAATLAATGATTQASGSEGNTDGIVAALGVDAQTAAEAAQAAAAAANTAKETLAQAQAALGSPATPEQIGAVETAQAAAIDAASAATSAAEAATAAASAAHAAAQAANEADPSGVAAANTAASAATLAATGATTQASGSEGNTDGIVAALGVDAQTAAEAAQAAAAAANTAKETLAQAQAALGSPATPEQIGAVETAQAAAIDAASAATSAAEAATAAASAAHAAAQAANEADPSGVAAANTAASAATLAATGATTQASGSEGNTDGIVAALGVDAQTAAEAAQAAAAAANTAKETLAQAQAALGSPATPEQIGAVETAQAAAIDAASAATSAAEAATAAASAAHAAAQAANEADPSGVAAANTAASAATLAATGATTQASGSEGNTDGIVAALGVDAQTAAEAAQAAAAAANTAKETLAQAQAALGSPATPEQIAAVETAQAAAIDAASAATSAAEAATAAASAAHAAAQAANEADPSGVAAANTAASAATLAATGATTQASGSEGNTDGIVAALGVDAQTAAEAAQAAAAAANTAKETLAQAQAALGSPATPEQIAAVETAQAAAIDAASAATSAAEAATAAASAAHAAAQAANEADPSGVAAANTAASAATLAAVLTALEIIQSAAQANNASATMPPLAIYSIAGIDNVNQSNLAAVNNALDSVMVNGVAVNTVAKVQALANSYNAILASADGVDNNAANPTQTQYTLIGVEGVDSAQKESLLGDVLDIQTTDAVDTVAAVQALADAVAAVMSGAAGGTAPTLIQLEALGLQNVNGNNLALVQAAIAATNNSGTEVDTLAKLQALITAINDPAIIGGTSTAALTESNAVQTATGTLTSTDADGTANLFMAQTNVAGSNGYGTFSITTGGVWTYTMGTAHDELVGGQSYTDSITVAAADGTTQVVTVTLTGTNDAAVISGLHTASLIEVDAPLTASGVLAITDVDSTAAFVAQANAAGSNNYGTFTLDTDGAWTYVMDSAHNEFAQGTNYTDSFTAVAADGTTQVVTVTIAGTNDAALIAGVSTRNLTESNVALSTSGTLTISDVDSATTFVAQANTVGSNNYGSFTLGTNGAWSYTMNGAHNEFVAGVNYTDSFTAVAADGTTKVVTVTMAGTNDAAAIAGVSTTSLTEADAPLTVSGALTITDVDGVGTFVAQASTVGSNNYGTFTLGTDGVWTYTMNAAHNEFVAGMNYTDSFTAVAADGTTKVVTVTMAGSNDTAVISGVATASLTEVDTPLAVSGALTITDVDGAANFVAQANAAGTNGYGTFTLASNGAWTYTMNAAHNEFVAGTNYTDSLTAVAADGTAQVVTVTIAGTNDAAVIAGVSTASLTESNVALSTSGTLTISDVDSATTFVAQAGTAGSNNYGTFTLAANGAWTYTMNAAHNEFVAGTSYTDSFTAISVDGTTQVVSVTIAGTNDAAVIAGVSTASLTESNVALSTSGTLTISDVDSATTFVAQASTTGVNGYGTFTLANNGAWTYTMNAPHNEFVADVDYTDSFTAVSADGTTKVVTVTIKGSNDAALIGGVSTNGLIETNTAQTANGTLTITDVDSAATFVEQANTVGASGYGVFSLTTNGAWTYTMDSAQDQLATGQVITDSFTAVSADGTEQMVTVTITGTNDAALITGVTNRTLSETNAVLSTSGMLNITDVDSASTFVAQPSTAGSNNYGMFTLAANGLWTYVMNGAHNEFVAGTNYTDSFTAVSADGTTQVITVTMAGSNDAAVITGTTTAALTETNSVQTATGALSSTDVDGTANLFTAQTNVAGHNGYGKFTITSAGAWTYTMDTAHDEFVAGTNYTDSFTATSADGTSQIITVTIAGANDAALIGGDATGTLTEANAAVSVSGALTITDADSPTTFVPQASTAGSNNYGTFTLASNGAWTYTMNGAHNEFVGGTNYTDSFTAVSADGTTKVVTVTLSGTNDPAVIAGNTTAALTETNAPTSTSGTLTITDVDGAATFVAQASTAGSNNYGTFTLASNGAWTYAMNSAHDEFVAGTNYTDSFTAVSADGTTQVVTVTIAGTNDAAVINGSITGQLTETNAVQSTTGTLYASDVDGVSNLFSAQTNVAGSNNFGKFTITTAGAWTYTLNTAHDEFAAGTNYTDSFTAVAADGTTQVVTVTIAGTNDAAAISGTSSATLTESNVVQTAAGTLTSTDVDGPSNLFVTQTNVVGNHGFGKFSIDSAGAWTYTMDTAHNEFVAGTNYTDSFAAVAADGTQQVVTVTMVGTNDAPVNTLPGAQTVVEDTQTAITGLSVTDVDGNLASTQLTVLQGLLNVSIAGGATISAGANNSATLTLSGTQVQINAALATLKYTGALDYNGSDTLAVLSKDNAGTPLTDAGTVSITVSAVNDAPTTAAIVYTCWEETPAPINGTTTGTAIADLPELIGKDAEGVVVGLAIVSPTSNSYATLWYSLNGGATWINLNTISGLSTTNALVLDKTARIYFQPGADKSGSNLTNVTQYTWDGTDGAVSGSMVNLTGKTGGSGAYAATSSSLQLSVTGINDVPSLSATAVGGTYAGTAVIAFSGASVYAGGSMGEGSQKFIKLGLTVSGLVDGAGEQLTVDGSTFSLINGTTGTTTTNGMTYTVSVTGTTATVTLTNAAGIASGAFNALVNSIAYNDTLGAPTQGSRVITLTTLQDNGGVANGGVDSNNALGLSSTINVTQPGVINLGGSGQLTDPVQVEGHWYYNWDMNGASNALNGGLNTITQQSLASIFKYDINGNAGSGLYMTDVYRYATLNGVLVAVPTLSGGTLFSANSTGTSASGESATINANLRFGDLLAVWDAFNGTASTTNISGIPTGWSSTLWTAESSAGYAYSLGLSSGTASVQNVSNGGSAARYGVALEVVQANHAPVLDASASPTLTSVALATAAPVDGNTTAGNLVSTLIGSSITDADAGALQGIAITSVNAGGTLYYSLNGGVNWYTSASYSQTISESNALHLAADSNTRVFFKANAAGTFANAFTFRAWDQTIFGEGAYADTTFASTLNGKTNVSAYSSNTDTAAIQVQTGTISLGAGQGQLIAPTLRDGHWYYYWDMNGDGLSSTAEVKSHDALDAIFKYDINGNLNPLAANGTNDVYRYATFNGVQVALPTLSQMPTSTPAAWAGWLYWTSTETTPNLTWHAMMDTRNGQVYGSYQDIDGGTVAMELVQANAAPVLNTAASPVFTTVELAASAPVNGSATTGNLVSELVGLNGSGMANVTDGDSGAVAGIAITGVHAGTVWYSLNDGTTWLSATGLSDTHALQLAPTARVYFQPDGSGTAGSTVSDAITFRAWDQTYGTSGSFADTTANGGKAAYSLAHDTVAETLATPVQVGASLDLGVVNGTHWSLIGKTDVNGKTYYHVDLDGTHTATPNDYIGTTHDRLDTIFNTGVDTTGLTSPAAGQDTERSVLVNGYTLILPTLAELQAIRVSAGNATPAGWAGNDYWASDAPWVNAHIVLTMSSGAGGNLGDDQWANFAVQVLANPAPALIGGQSTASLTETNAAQTASGTLTITNVSGVTFTAQANVAGNNNYGAFSLGSNGAWTYTMNSAHNEFMPAINYTDSFTAVASDGTSQTVTVTIAGTNDAPVNIVPGAQTALEDIQVAITGISVSDVDGNLASTQLSVVHGTLNVSTAGGASISTGANDSATLTLSGTQAQINAALSTVKYTSVLNYNGADTLNVLSKDNAGTPLQASDTVNLSVTAVNDAPTLSATAVGGTSTGGSTVLAFSGSSVSAGASSESTQTFIKLGLTVSGLADAAGEHLTVDGSTFSLTDATTGTTATNGMTYQVSVVGTTATVTLTKAAGVGSNAFNTLMDGLGYSNAMSVPTSGSRVITLTTLQDDGGVTNGGIDTRTLVGMSSTFNVSQSSTIDLGTSGQLVAPVQVEGHWYYFWDMNGSSNLLNAGLNTITQTGLEAVFKYDINGNLNPGTALTEVYRYANLNGVLVALPTVNGGQAFAEYAMGNQVTNSGTAATGQGTTSNTIYNDSLAVWDAFNGTSTSTGLGTTGLAGWTRLLWAAQTSGVYSYIVDYAIGGAAAQTPSSYLSPFPSNAAALEVVQANHAPLLDATASPSMTSVALATAAPVNGNTTAGELLSTLVSSSITDADAGALKGIAVTSVNTGGKLYYSLNGGTTWLQAMSVTESNALHLAADSNTRVFFKATSAGTFANAFTFRAWDQTIFGEGAYADTTFASTLNGKTNVSAYSSNTDTVSIQVVPLVIDLNRDGTLSYSQVVMDVNGDGLLDQTAWAGAPDGVLVWDKYADGLVHDASQYAFAQYGGNSDLQGLAAGFDTHQDGKFDAQDAKFAEFKVWQDLNQNGISDAGEVRSLADWGITEIKLSSDGVVRTPAAGVTEAGRTTATTTDGTSILVADAGFDNASLDYSVTPAATPGGAKLNVLGSGMSLDLSRFIAQHGAMAEVDLSGTGANTLTLRLNDVLQGAASTLKVTGDANDVLNAQLAAEWTASGAVVTDNGHSYAVYNANANAAAQLLIDERMLHA